MQRSDPKHEVYFDPVQAYDHIAPDFERLSNNRRAYLSSIEKIVISEIPHGSISLLDVGAGDGSRAFRIARTVAVKYLVLLEPSTEMRRNWYGEFTAWPIRAENLSEKSGFFDVITCLWNVIGHIFPHSTRIAIMRQCAQMLSPGGRMFIDLNYRYNARHYGFLRTFSRILRDLISPSEKNGDVRVRWDVHNVTYATDGHVFTHREFYQMARAAGLVVERRVTVDYVTGQIHRSKFDGNPLYILRRPLTNGA